MSMGSRSGIQAGKAFVLIQAMDGTAAVFNQVGKNLTSLGNKFERLRDKIHNFSLSLNDSTAAVFNQVGKNLTSLGNKFERLRDKIHNLSLSLNFAGKGMMMLGGALAIPLKLSLNTASEYSDELLRLQAVLKATDAEMVPLVQHMEALKTSFSPLEIAQAATAAAQGGMNPQQIMASMQAFTDLARAGGVSLSESARIVADVMSTFKIDAEEATRIVDAFFIAAKRGTVEVNDMVQSFKYVGLTVNSMNMSLEESLAILSALSKRMLKMTPAGTSLNQFLISVASNVEKLDGALKDSLFVNGEPLPMLPMLMKLLDHLETLDTKSKMQFLQEVFNVRGARVGTAIDQEIIQEMIDTLAEMKVEIGAARAAAEKMDSGIGGSLRRIGRAFYFLRVAVGESLEGLMRDFENIIVPYINGLRTWVRANRGVAESFAKLVVGLLAGGGALILLGAAIRAISFAIVGLGAPLFMIIGLFNVLSTVTGIVFGVLGVAISGLIGAMTILSTLFSLVFSGSIIAVLLKMIPAMIAITFILHGLIGLWRSKQRILERVSDTFSQFAASMAKFFEGMLTAASMAFGRIGDIGANAFEKIKKALELGDYETALKAVKIAVSAMWEALIETMKFNWDEFVTYLTLTIGKAFKDMGTLFQETISTLLMRVYLRTSRTPRSDEEAKQQVASARNFAAFFVGKRKTDKEKEKEELAYLDEMRKLNEGDYKRREELEKRIAYLVEQRLKKEDSMNRLDSEGAKVSVQQEIDEIDRLRGLAAIELENLDKGAESRRNVLAEKLMRITNRASSEIDALKPEAPKLSEEEKKKDEASREEEINETVRKLEEFARGFEVVPPDTGMPEVKDREIPETFGSLPEMQDLSTSAGVRSAFENRKVWNRMADYLREIAGNTEMWKKDVEGYGKSNIPKITPSGEIKQLMDPLYLVEAI